MGPAGRGANGAREDPYPGIVVALPTAADLSARPDPESGPQLIRAFATDGDAGVRGRRSFERADRSDVVGRVARVDDHWMPIPEQLERQGIRMAVSGLLVGTERTVLEEQLMLAFADHGPPGIG